MKTPLIALFAAAALSMPALAQDRNANPPRNSQGQTRPHQMHALGMKRERGSMQRQARRVQRAKFRRSPKVGPEPLHYPPAWVFK